MTFSFYTKEKDMPERVSAYDRPQTWTHPKSRTAFDAT